MTYPVVPACISFHLSFLPFLSSKGSLFGKTVATEKGLIEEQNMLIEVHDGRCFILRSQQSSSAMSPY